MSTEWGALRRLAFRFAFVYGLLFWVPMLASSLPVIAIAGEWYDGLCTRLCVWLGHHLLHITREIPTRFTGSGDTTRDWIYLACVVTLSMAVTIIWSLFDGKRSHPRLYELLRIVLRYSLALTMVGYGVIKLVGGQFPPPSVGRLLESYGESSPTGLLWTFMGASPAYVVFSGAGETLGAVLLLFRRTTTLGALILAGVLTNIVMMNFCYDVPVKINSAHYLLTALFLTLPDLGRLGNVLLFNRAAGPVDTRLILPRRWLRAARPILKYGLLALLLVLQVRGLGTEMKAYQATTKSWLEGYWKVERMVRNGSDVPAVLNDATRWRRIKLESEGDKLYLRWHNMDASFGPLYDVVADEAHHTLTLTLDADEKEAAGSAPSLLALQRGDADHFTLEGTIGADRLKVELERLSPEKMPLLSRGFHLINEVPFNR